jgi:hypothetical protein
MVTVESPEQRVMEAEGRERLLALALTAVLRERGGDGGSGVVIGDGEEHYMFFTDGNELRMTTVDKDDPVLALGMFEIDRKPYSVN